MLQRQRCEDLTATTILCSHRGSFILSQRIKLAFI
jgi:hypothetical protein